jgi:hypothetical protein
MNLMTGLLRPTKGSVVNPAGATLEGTVKTANGQALPQAVIVLIPEGPNANRSDHTSVYRIGTADQKGRYVVRGIVPGQYRVYAGPRQDQIAYWDAEFVREFGSLSRVVTLAMGEAASSDLTALPIR